MHILLAEDETVTRLAARALLERAGHRVVAVEDGPTAVAAAAGNAFDLILMDLGLPGLPGDDAVRAIRRQPNGAAPRILMLTASATAQGRSRCDECGADGILTKPLRLDVLSTALDGRSPAASPATEPAFDEDAITTMREMLPAARAAELIGKAATVLRRHGLVLDEALAAGDMATAGAMAHKIAGVSGQYGCLALRRAARALEGELERPGADPARRASELAGILAPALEFLERRAAAGGS
ncbi:response regulator [Azospirillum sp. YIM B02556]|uniref:Response regulator n=1 Tax=Azospirillum endophyticum TaxID=2800326 RepID=A0ABS1FD48_9PROT|nr:response regulator [Azospirillum endophyticum]